MTTHFLTAYAALSVLSIAVSSCLAASPARSAPVDIVVLPPGWSSIDTAVDESGTVHAGFILDRAVSYSSWDSDSRIWRQPVRVSSNAEGARVFDVRIAAKRAGSAAFVAWTQDHEIKGAVLDELRGTPRVIEKTLTKGSTGDAEMPAVTFSPDDTLYAVWIDHRANGPVSEVIQFVSQYMPQRLTSLFGSRAEFASADLWFAVSRDGGRTFDEGKTINNLPVCECCEPSIIATPEHGVSVVHRSTVQSVKEVQLLTSVDQGLTFKGKQISDDKWKFVGCPNSGPQLRVEDGGRHLSAHWLANGSIRGVALNGAGGPIIKWPDLPKVAGSKCDHFMDGDKLFVVAAAGAVFEMDADTSAGAWKESRGLFADEGVVAERIISDRHRLLVLVRRAASHNIP